MGREIMIWCSFSARSLHVFPSILRVGVPFWRQASFDSLNMTSSVPDSLSSKGFIALSSSNGFNAFTFHSTRLFPHPDLFLHLMSIRSLL
jgi:hypothetical protein